MKLANVSLKRLMMLVYPLGEGESLLKLHNIGKGIMSGAQEDLSPGESEGAAAEEAQDPTGETNGMTIADRKKLSMNDGETVEGENMTEQTFEGNGHILCLLQLNP